MLTVVADTDLTPATSASSVLDEIVRDVVAPALNHAMVSLSLAAEVTAARLHGSSRTGTGP